MEISQQKALGLAVVASLITVLTFVLIGLITRDPAALGSPVGLLTVMLTLAWAAVIAVSYAILHSLQRHRRVIVGVAAVSAALAGLFSAPAIIGGVLLLVFMESASRMIATDTHDRINVRLYKMLLPGLRLLLTGLALATVALLLPLVRTQVSSGKIFIPTDSIELALRPAAPILQNIIPGYSPDSTVDDLIDVQLNKQRQSLPPGILLGSGQRDQTRQALSETLGVGLTGSETVADILTIYTNTYIQRLADQSGLVVTTILIVIGLVAVRAIVPLLAWLALGVAYSLFWVLRRFDFVRITQTQLPVQQLQL